MMVTGDETLDAIRAAEEAAKSTEKSTGDLSA
jgi:hypothetical protein